MPIPLTETEQYFAHQIGEIIQEQAPENRTVKKDPIPKTKAQSRKSISEKITEFFNDIVTPKGT